MTELMSQIISAIRANVTSLTMELPYSKSGKIRLRPNWKKINPVQP